MEREGYRPARFFLQIQEPLCGAFGIDMKNNSNLFYEQPSVEVFDVEVEVGFAESGGSGLTNGGIDDEQGWSDFH